MLDISTHSFGAQYQQKPFLHMNDEGTRGDYFAAPDDEWGFPLAAFYLVPETTIMAYELFGVGKHHPAMPPRQMTMEEWKRYSVWTMDYRRRLLEDPKRNGAGPTTKKRLWLPTMPGSAGTSKSNWRQSAAMPLTGIGGCRRGPGQSIAAAYIDHAFRSRATDLP